MDPPAVRDAREHFPGLIGVSERGLRQGLASNNATANINSIDAAMRSKDAEFYDGMPMNTVETDPVNRAGDVQDEADLLAVIEANAKAAYDASHRAPASAPPAAAALAAATAGLPPSLDLLAAASGSTSVLHGCSHALTGLVHDLQHWDALPCRTSRDKVKYVMQQDNRVYYMIALMVVVIVIMSIIRRLAG
jgi:hypothetical protein